ncbi:MAG: Methionyl-tRNA formyltransferase [uncultured bacterium]|nr:MAG: Methionyl-tRNA formyltransferase [uncultured bacterium]
MGTSDLSEAILESLINNEYNLVGVFTKPDTKVGRKQEIVEPLVKKMAKAKNIPVFQPAKFKDEGTQALKELAPDLVIVAAYGKIIPEVALEIPKFGFINVHVSILPKYRGASPIQNALLAGEKETGVTIMLMDQGIDTGDILAQEITPIEDQDTTESLMARMAGVGANLLIKTLPNWIEGGIDAKKQDHELATFCKLISREDGKISWTDSAEKIQNQFRAMTPWPGVFTFWKNGSKLVRLKLNSISKTDSNKDHQMGEVFQIGNEVAVQTGEGAIILREIQKEGKKSSDLKSFINGHKNFIGSILQ